MAQAGVRGEIAAFLASLFFFFFFFFFFGGALAALLDEAGAPSFATLRFKFLPAHLAGMQMTAHSSVALVVRRQTSGILPAA